MSKELFMQAHEQLVEEAMELDPTLTWSQAYALTAVSAYDRMRDNIADMADNLRDLEKDRRLMGGK